MWYTLDNYQSNEPGTVSARIRVNGDSPLFDGHFPGDPTLPGVGQLAMVTDVIGHLLGYRCRTRGVRRVKFRRRIGPGDVVQVTAVVRQQEKKDRIENEKKYSFRITTNTDQLISSGIMTIIPTQENTI